jgi:peptidoglycan/LPS O-acetylase OafA/YrhL
MIHYRILECWRLTAALLVMVWHYLRYAPAEAEAASNILYKLLPLMEMFLMISGFLIMMRYADTLLTERGAWRRFILRRITRLYPLYLATLLFFVLIGLALNAGFGESHWPGRYDFATLPQNLLLVQAWGLTDNLTFNYVAWTLSAEWFCYLAFPLIVFVAMRWGMGGLAALTVATIILLELATARGIIPFDSWLLADTWGAYRAFADFCIGALVALAVRASPAVPARHGQSWFVMGLAVVAMQSDQNSYLILLLLAFSIYLAALAEAARPLGSSWLKPLAPLGKVSFGIYLIHPVVETIFFSVIWKTFPAVQAMGFYVFWLIPITVSIAVALASDRYFEGPTAAWLNGIFDPRKAPRTARA